MNFKFLQTLALGLVITGISHATTSFAAEYPIRIHSIDNHSTNNSKGFFSWLYNGIAYSVTFVYEEGFRKCLKGTRQSKARQNLERIFPLPDLHDIESGLRNATNEPLLSSPILSSSSNADSDEDSNTNSDARLSTNMSPPVSTTQTSDASICSDAIVGRSTLPTPAPAEVLITLQNVLKKTEELQQERDVANFDPDVLFPVLSTEEATRQYVEELRASRARTKAYSKLMRDRRRQPPQTPEIATQGTQLENSHGFAEQINNPQLQHYGTPKMPEPAPQSQPMDNVKDHDADSDYVLIPFRKDSASATAAK